MNAAEKESLSKRRRKARAGRTLTVKAVRTDAAINVTPLIDVVLVLLIIFMVMTPLVERDLGVHLSTEKRTEAADDVAPTQVLVSVEGTGNLQINSQPVSHGDYVGRLRDLLGGREPEDQVVFVVAGDDANYASLVEAIDRAKQAGATTVGLATDAVATPAPAPTAVSPALPSPPASPLAAPAAPTGAPGAAP